MSFLIFKKERDDSGPYYSNADQYYKLAGNNLLNKLWKRKNCPVEQGWSVTASEILLEHDAAFSHDHYALVIDFHPDSKSRIGLVEIEAIHIYTYGEVGKAYWSPLMLELRDVYYNEDFGEEISSSSKSKLLEKVNLAPNRRKIVEFLYLQGDWKWGRNGSTNAAFIHDEPRRYFQTVFSSNLG